MYWQYCGHFITKCAVKKNYLVREIVPIASDTPTIRQLVNI